VTRTDLPVTKLDEDEDSDKDLDTRDVEPAEESPAAAGVTEAPESDAFTETEPAAGTAYFDEIPESETASTPATERPLARSRSLFEPLDHEDTATTDDADTDDATALDVPDAATPDVADEDPADGPAPSTTYADADANANDADTDDDITADRHVDAEPDDAEPDDAEPEHESPAESAAASVADETSAADEEATDEHDGDTAEPTGTTPAADDAFSADEPDDAFSDADADADGDHADTESAEHPDLPFVRILSGTKRYHRPDCALIEDIAEDADDLETMSPAEAIEGGCTPCLVCQPDKAPEDRY